MLNQLGYAIDFIDINSFVMPFDINTGVTLVTKQIMQATHPVILIAYSTGGLIAINIANNQPNLIAKLILINSTPCFMSQHDWHGIPDINLTKLTTKLHNLSFMQFITYFSNLVTYPAIIPMINMSMWHSSNCNSETTNKWLAIIATTDLRPMFNAIMLPVLLIYSDQDHLVPHNNDLVSDNICQQVLSDSNHAQFAEQQLLQYIRTWML